MCLKCNTKSEVKKSKTACMQLYNELVQYDLKSIEIYSKTKDSRFLPINKQLRVWISNLKRECPPDDSLELIKNILDDYEYPIN